MERREFSKRLGLFTAAAAGSTVLTACGGGNDDVAEPPVAAPGPAPAPVPAPAAPLSPLPTRLFNENRLVLSEPMLQLPTADSVRVVWFTEFKGVRHTVRFGVGLTKEVEAVSVKLSRMYEDATSQVAGRTYTALTERDIYRHEATVSGLKAGERLPYVALSDDGTQPVRSGDNTLQPLPATGHRLRLLLTSDLQLKKMAAANYERVAETLAPIDGVLFAGDLVNVPNRASEWFDNGVLNNPPFFAALQGTMNKWQPTSTYSGGNILQNAWIYPILGNHEYSGRWRPEKNDLGTMFNDPQPRWYAEMRYDQQAAVLNPRNDAMLREKWIRDNSFETVSYEEIFTLPQGPEGERYYAQRIGDLFLIAMDGNRIWRGWGANTRGKFSEATASLNKTDEWGFGDFQFWPFAKGSRQYAWLLEVLASEAFRTAKYKVVMVHQSVFGLGDNATPVMAQTQASFEYIDANGARQVRGPFAFPIAADVWATQIQPLIDSGFMGYVKYDYPLSGDLWKTEIEPLLMQAGVQLVHVGHSHLWCRSKVGNMHYLETSNVGNSYGAYIAELTAKRNKVPTPTQTQALTSFTWNQDDYPLDGDPHDRLMALPSLRNPMAELAGTGAVPFVSSNDITAYTVFDSGTGIVSSYAFDTRYPARDPIKFDEFSLI
jgi:hypothetical protein